MKKTAIIAVAIYLPLAVAAGQKDAAELARLRSVMGLPDSTVIAVANTHSQVRGYVLARRADGFEVLALYGHNVKLSEPRKDLGDAFLTVIKRQADMKNR